MRKKRMIILSLGAMILLFWGVMRQRPNAPFFSYTQNIMGIYIVQDDILENKVKLNMEENPGILFEGVLLPYDVATNTLYLPQSIAEEQWSGHLSAQVSSQDNNDFFVCAPADEKWFNKSEAIQKNYKYTLWLVSENEYFEFQLIVTGTPVIAINTERMEIPVPPTYEEDPDRLYFGSETLYYGAAAVFDPDMSGDGYMITEIGICYHQKGATAGTFSKKSYSIEFIDENEAGVNVSLLGMRADNSWKLNSLYTDASRVREITSSQIWENFDAYDTAVNEPGPRMEYVELVLDGQYQGLYCLVEPVDRKKLQLDSTDFLYKVIGWNVPDNDGIQDSIAHEWKIQASVRIRYPKEIYDYSGAWLPIQNYLYLFYWGNEFDYKDGLAAVDINNVLDFSFFVMATSASDNYYKNTFLAAYHMGDGYKFLQIPWDLDYTFGNVYMYAELPVRFESDVTLAYRNEVLENLHYVAPYKIDPLIWERWNEYRNSFLNIETIRELLEDNRDYLVRTGASARESERWPDTNVNMDVEYILEYQESRFEWLDSFYYEWTRIGRNAAEKNGE